MNVNRILFIFQDLQTLKQLKLAQSVARDEKWHDNVATLLMEQGNSTVISEDGLKEEDTEVVKALQEKYDALKDKLLMEASLSISLYGMTNAQ